MSKNSWMVQLELQQAQAKCLQMFACVVSLVAIAIII